MWPFPIDVHAARWAVRCELMRILQPTPRRMEISIECRGGEFGGVLQHGDDSALSCIIGLSSL